MAAILAPDAHALSPDGVGVRLQFDRMLLKANPSMEGGQRVVYLEASTEVRDLQGDKVLQSALQAAIPYFLQYGRIDLDHASVTGEIRGARVNPYAFEIGKPLSAKADGGSIWVKAGIFSSLDPSNKFTEAADIFWDSLHTSPAVSWYPSIAGDVFSEQTIEENGQPTQEVRGLRWHSIGLSRTPVNQGVGPVTTVPVRAFAKAFSSVADLRQSLSILSPKGQALLPKQKGELDVVGVLRVLSAGHASLDTVVKEAASKGIPADVVMATVLALLPSSSGA
jgi:hypothetical protein